MGGPDSGVLGHRNGEGEPRPQARPVALGPYPAPVGLHYPLADGETQARPRDVPSPVLAVDAGELAEQVRQPLGGYPPALVRDGDRHVVALPHGRYPDGRRLVGVPGRVGEEVVQHLDDAPPVRHDQRQLRREVDAEVAPAPSALEPASGLVHQGRHVRRRGGHRQFARLDARHGVNVSFDEVIVFTDPQIYNGNVFVLPVSENLAADDLPLRDYAERFYDHFNDEFDFLMFVPNLQPGQHEPGVNIGAYYAGIRNDVKGIGESTFTNNDSWGSAGKLQGVIDFGSYAIYSDRRSILFEGPTLHELMHRWANFIVPTSYGGHWGFSSANGNIGGFDIAKLVDHGGGRYTAGSFTIAGVTDNVRPYSPIELYLAGFIPREEVPDLWVAEDEEWLRDEEGRIVHADNGHPMFTASQVRTYTIEDIIAEHGPRVPDSSQAQRDFRAAVILLVDQKHPATREALETLSDDVFWFSHAGEDELYRYNFYEATSGRGTIKMGGLSEFLKDSE